MLASESITTKADTQERFNKLIEVSQNASLKEFAFNKTMHDHYGPKSSDVNNHELEMLATVTLPEAVGKLIALLDLQHAFLSLGHYVRSFADAAYVFEKLQDLIKERLNNCIDAAKRLAVINELIACSESYATGVSYPNN